MPSSPPRIRRKTWSEIEGFGRRYLARIAAGDTETALREFVDFWSGAGAWDAMDDSSRAQMHRASAKLALDFRATFADPVLIPSGVRLPVHLVAGDRACSDPPSPRCSPRLPSATLQVVAGNHFLPTTHHRMPSDPLLAQLRIVAPPTAALPAPDRRVVRREIGDVLVGERRHHDRHHVSGVRRR